MSLFVLRENLKHLVLNNYTSLSAKLRTLLNALTRALSILGKSPSRRQSGSSDCDPALGAPGDLSASCAPAGEAHNAVDRARVEGAAPETGAEDLKAEDR